ncbi:hypothetical protein EDF38_0364 [Frigoribacterium sp. PhB160]|uniref:DUF4380 domain-containing protein n=1 Tax=Frigoribacterium sp. PhB160 TaxID=2485192 RepID=UPI000F498EE2|nr:DUF4380 domain-containing protein [Frigoribacterium sp. PhB160]ROS61277.1 hypothetical protein EDF38_0364 [Frigoribacterium sp. PhB160]
MTAGPAEPLDATGGAGPLPAPVVAPAGTPELPLLRVATADLVLTFAPTRGGRLLSLVAGGRELLWHDPLLLDSDLAPVRPVASWPASDGDMSTWANVGGSKTWPAPQGWSGPEEWAGPPDPVLDSGAWTAAWTTTPGLATVTLTSADDPRSGLRVERRFTVPSSGTAFTQTATFTNVSAVPRTWSIWEVCQVDTAGGAGRPVEEAAVVVAHAERPVELDLGSWEGRVASTRHGDDVLLPVGSGVAKRGYPEASGSVAYRADGLALELATVPVPGPGGTWPDGGSKVEVWLQRPTAEPITSLGDLHPAAHLVELEVLGPLTTLAPGGSTSLDVSWSVSVADRSR